MLSLNLPKEVYDIAEKIYINRSSEKVEGTAEEDFLNACKQFDAVNK